MRAISHRSLGGVCTKFRIHGYGGQGVATAARVLSRAGMLSGLKVQDLVFGDEWGEPAVGFVRLSKSEISEKGIIEDPDYVLVFHADLMPPLKDMKDGSFIIINDTEKPTSLWIKKKKLRVYYLDATSLALNSTGKPIPNTPMLGALLKSFSKISMRNLKLAIEAELHEKQKENQLAAEEGFKTVR